MNNNNNNHSIPFLSNIVMTFRSLFDDEIDLSFALPKETPLRRQRATPLPSTRRNFRSRRLDDDDNGTTRRSVAFAENPVSEVISVPRYEKERIPELFYDQLDVARFRHEVRLERMRIKILW
ncbi:hypothetical protein ACHAW6_015753 [Cyclotella cf. meneghiniana]